MVQMSIVNKWFGFGRDDRYDRGIRAFDQGQYEEAIGEFRECLAKSTDPATNRLARFYMSESYANLGQASLLSQNYEVAAEHLRHAIELHPHYPDLHLRISYAYRGLGDRTSQSEAIGRALFINPNYAEAILQRGILWYEDGRSDEALAEIERAVSVEPGLGGERYQFALECHRNGDTARALANFATMTGADSKDANTHARVADSFVKQSLFEEAAQEYDRALQIAPGYADIRCKLGQVLLQMDLVERAEIEFRRALEINSAYVDAWASLGIALRRLRREDEAKVCFDRALELDPHNVVAKEEALRR